jgi:trk system potassium uptake protein
MPIWSPPPGTPGAATVGFRFPAVRLRAQSARVALTAAAAGGVVLLHGFAPPPLPQWAIVAIQLLLVAAYYLDVVLRQRSGREPIPGQRFDWIDGLILVALGAGLLGGAIMEALPAGADPARSPWIIAEAAIVWLFITEMWRLNVGLSRRLRRPGILFPSSFLLMILIGTLLIKIPIATPEDRHLTWLDALFTMTSAVCITGLVVRDTGTDFTPLGQTIIAMFFQLGAIGFILFGSMVALMLGQRISLRGNMDMSHMLQGQSIDRLKRFTRFILVTIIVVELIGALAMYPMWDYEEGMSAARRVGFSLFHSISAFCNAGFELTGSSAVPYRYAALSHLVIAPLIVIGGIGFPLLANLASVLQHRLRGARAWWLRRVAAVPSIPAGPMPTLAEQRLTLHTKLVLSTTVVLYLLGFAVIAIAQAMLWIPQAPDAIAAAPRGAIGTLLDASFMSISARNAGFNSMPMEEVQPAGRFTLMLLMFLGGSPGSAAGGVKTTAVAILFWSVVSTLRQRRETEIFGRSISDSLVRMAGTIAICYAGLIIVVTVMLSLSEAAPFGVVLFEAVSAATTTGLSLGLTPHLTPFGKVVVIAAMYLGRIGPLALFAALALRRRDERPYAYPHESVALG